MKGSWKKYVSFRHFPSVDHASAARLFSSVACDAEASGGAARPYVIATVLTAVAFLEAVTNELLGESDPEDGSPISFRGLNPVFRQRLGQLGQLPVVDRMTSAIEKTTLILVGLGLEPISPGCQPGQDVQSLYKLRNALVHGRPSWVPVSRVVTHGGAIRIGDVPQGDRHELEKALAGRFQLVEGPSTRPFFPDRCLSAGCARWANRSVSGYAREVFRRLEMSPYVQTPEPEETGSSSKNDAIPEDTS